MPGQVNTTQRVGVTAWRGTVTKDNHIYGLFAANQQKADRVMRRLYSSMYLPTLNTYLSEEVPVREFDDDSEFTYDVAVSSHRNIPLIEARKADGSTVGADDMVGVGFEPFYLVFPEDWFADGEVLWGNLNEVYPVIVKEQPKIEGTNYVYLVEPFGAHLSGGIPGDRLQAGERFSWGYAPIEKSFSRKVGDIRFSSAISLSGNFQHVRIQYKIGGEEIGKLLSANIPINGVVDGRKVSGTVNRWMLNETWTLEKTFETYKNNALDRGVSTIMENGEVSNMGKSGLPNRQGSGLRQYQAMGNVVYYDKFNLDLFTKYMSELFYGRQEMNKRNVIVRTGEMGLKMLNEAIKADVSGWTPIVSSEAPSYITKGKDSNFARGNAISVKEFIVSEWISATGIHVTLVLDSSKDDTVTNKMMHPKGGTAESYRLDISVADDEDGPNIQKLTVKNRPDRRGYQWGPFFNPFTGAANNMSASFDEDAAVAHMKSTLGIIVYDVTRCVSMIPNMLMG